METILVATDFSERSDQALARAALIATRSGARLHLIHVVDDDQKQRIIDSETTLSQQLLDEEAEKLNRIGGLTCTTAVVLGDPFEGIGNAADAINPDLVVLGAHRRRVLRDVFVGTTAQRTIRRSRWPVLMVNALPEHDYVSVMLATDLSATSHRAIEQFLALDLSETRTCSLLHIFDAPIQHLSLRSALTKQQLDRYVGEMTVEASQVLAEFAATLPAGNYQQIAHPQGTGVSAAILETAAQMMADLIVVTSQGRVGLSKTFLGSVAEEVLRRADRDVLTIPPNMAPA